MSTVPTLSILEPVKLRSGAEHVADRLVTAIALGEFVTGQRLPSERDLASTLEVSRTTIREAIQRLAAKGHVQRAEGARGAGGARLRRRPAGPHRWRLRAPGPGSRRDRDDPADAPARVAQPRRPARVPAA